MKTYWLLTCVGLVGCSLLSTSPVVAPNNQTSLQSQIASDIPFKLSVAEEHNDGARLSVLASVIPQTDWSAEDVVLKLSGLKDGHALNYAFNKLSKDAALKVGEEVRLPVSIPAAGISEYQLELFWGNEARLVMAEADKKRIEEATVVLRNLEIERTIENCIAPPCAESFILTGELFNNGHSVLKQVTLGVGFEWHKLGAEAIPAAEEEEISVPGLSLAPGAARKLKLVFDPKTPPQDGGEFKPILRIVSFG